MTQSLRLSNVSTVFKNEVSTAQSGRTVHNQKIPHFTVQCCLRNEGKQKELLKNSKFIKEGLFLFKSISLYM